MKKFILFCLLVSLTAVGVARAQDSLAARMLKNIIDVSASYHGERLFVYGVVPDDCDLIVTVMSELDTCVMSYKGKRGPLWMNIGKMSFVNCPHMYKLKSTRPVHEILPDSTRRKYHIGLDAVKANFAVLGVENPEFFVQQLFDLRIHENLYSVEEGIIQIHPGKLFDASFYWPAKAKVGKYQVDVYAVRDGGIVNSVSETVNVQKIGVEQWLSFQAQNHAVLYGVVSAFIAVLFGVLVSFLTRGIVFYLSTRKSIRIKP